jgi:hypothetical protein
MYLLNSFIILLYLKSILLFDKRVSLLNKYFLDKLLQFLFFLSNGDLITNMKFPSVNFIC